MTYILPGAWQYPPLRGKGVVGHMSVFGLFQRTIFYPAGEGEESGVGGKVVARITLSATTRGTDHCRLETGGREKMTPTVRTSRAAPS